MNRFAIFGCNSFARQVNLWAALAVLAPMLAGCSLALPKPEGGQPAAIGVSIRENWETGDWFEEQPEMVYFIRLGEGDDLTKPREVIPSNYFRDHRLYLLNAKPGRYALVASSEFVQRSAPPGKEREEMSAGLYRPGRQEAHAIPIKFLLDAPRTAMMRIWGKNGDNNDRFIYTSYFSEAMVRQTVVEVLPGRLTVMGTLRVKRHIGMLKSDPVQRHYWDTLEVDVVDPYGYPIMNDSSDNSIASRGELGEINRENAAVTAFLRQALQDFRGTAWEGVVRDSLPPGD